MERGKIEFEGVEIDETKAHLLLRKIIIKERINIKTKQYNKVSPHVKTTVG